VLCSIDLIKKPTLSNALATGVLFGLAMLCRATLQFFPIVFALIFIFTAKKHKIKALYLSAFLIIITLIVISPWTIRNYHVSDRFILIRSTGYETSSTYNKEIINNNALLSKSDANFITGIFNRFTSIKGLKSIISKGTKFWYWGQSRLTSMISLIINVPLLLIGIVGLIIALKNRRNVFLLVLVIVYFNILHALWGGRARYSVPIMPYVIMFAAYGLFNIIKKFQGNYRKTSWSSP